MNFNKCGLNTKIYMRDSKFQAKDRTVNLHPTKGTHWASYTFFFSFGSYGAPQPQLFSDSVTKRKRECVFPG